MSSDTSTNGSDDEQTQRVQSLEISSGNDESVVLSARSESSILRGIAALPLLFLLGILSVTKAVLGSILPSSVIRPISSLIESNRENDDILREMPKQQRVLKQNMANVERDQVEIQNNMHSLRRRIQKIEERREKWANQAETIREAERRMNTDTVSETKED
mmetsp:Transcript_48854/g.147198  ORF Transcript_48854/g.147198 Transcript_48854/m.147198 type:complete len:161 (-) Transcript_48854:141-623(-)